VTENPNTLARDFCVQFVYQSETLKIFHWSETHFETFVAHFGVTGEVRERTRALAVGVLDKRETLDEELAAGSKNWGVGRMGALDRIILRTAVFELKETETPPKVILNEAVELAKKYGGDQSGAFVNGVLDGLAKRLRKGFGK
jgi:N utilization substance protein B